MKKVFLVVAAFSSSLLHAQKDTVVQSLDEVTITATRFAKKISETGKVVTIIGQEELQRAGGKDLSQILNEQAGLIINGAWSNPGKDKQVYLRGAKSAYTLILINGVPVADPSGVAGAFDLRMIPVEQIEKIEIVKGAQSTLYGAEAVAGVINILTKNGGEKPVTVYGGFAAGNYSTIKAHAGIRGSQDGSSYNVTFLHNETNGVPEAKDTNAVKTFPNNGYIQNAVNAELDLLVTKGLYIKPFFRHSYFSGTYSGGAFVPAVNEFKSSYQAAGTQVVYSFGSGTITGLFSNDDVKRSFKDSWGGSVYGANKKTAEVFSHFNLSNHVQLLAGLRYDRQRMEKPSITVADTAVYTTSPYISLFLKEIGGIFNLELGSRYNNNSKFGNHFTYSINPSVFINKNIKLFANIGTAFKAPGLSELFGQWGANPDLKPEKSTTMEGGIQTTIGITDLRAVYFNRTIKDVIIYGMAYTNHDKQKDQGFEIESAFHFTEKLKLRLNYAYVDGKVTTKSGGTDTSYFNLIRRPKHSGGAFIGYQLTPTLFISTDIQFFGKRDDLFFNNTTWVNEPKTLSAYSLWNAYIEYGIPKNRARVFAQVNNILNTNYYEVYGYTTLGTNFTGGIRFSL